MNANKRTIIFYAIIALAVTNLLLWDKVIAGLKAEDTKNTFSIQFLDVGQGDATLIQTPDNRQILIDGGPKYPILQNNLDKAMPPNDKKIDAVILTHPDSDHLAGLVELLKHYQVDLAIFNPSPQTSALFQQWQAEIKNLKIKTAAGLAGESLDYKNQRGQTIFNLAILYPLLNSDDNSASNKDTNEQSIVAKLSFDNQSFLLTGDAPQDIEALLTKTYSEDYLNIDILKVSHHGSKSATSINFVKALTPATAVISCGLNNSYGHPDKSVLDNLKGAQILRTDLQGSIRFLFDQSGIKINCEKADCSDS
jgi:competence protein ComEC